jgi:hypothetical protein
MSSRNAPIFDVVTFGGVAGDTIAASTTKRYTVNARGAKSVTFAFIVATAPAVCVPTILSRLFPGGPELTVGVPGAFTTHGVALDGGDAPANDTWKAAFTVADMQNGMSLTVSAVTGANVFDQPGRMSVHDLTLNFVSGAGGNTTGVKVVAIIAYD